MKEEQHQELGVTELGRQGLWGGHGTVHQAAAIRATFKSRLGDGISAKTVPCSSLCQLPYITQVFLRTQLNQFFHLRNSLLPARAIL